MPRPLKDVIYRATRGAVRDVLNAHPEYRLHPGEPRVNDFARSVAKRAAGHVAESVQRGRAALTS